MPENFQDMWAKAVDQAEAVAEANNAKGEVEGILDSETEIMEFAHTALRQIEEYLQDCPDDPRLGEIRAEMTRLYEEVLECIREGYWTDRYQACRYWQRMVRVLEFPERMALRHPDENAPEEERIAFARRLGLPEGIKLWFSTFYPNDESYHYTLRTPYHQGYMQLVFKKDGEIEIQLDQDWLSVYPNFLLPKEHKSPEFFERNKQVSLADLQDPATFEVHLALAPDLPKRLLTDLIDKLEEALPKRTTNDTLRSLQDGAEGVPGIVERAKALLARIGALDPVSVPHIERCLEEIQVLFVELLDPYLELAEEGKPFISPYLQGVIKEMTGDYPHLLEPCLKRMRTKEELDLFRMLASGNPYSDKLRAERYEALPHADVDGPEQLSEEHQRIFERYKDVLPNGTEFMGALARFPLGDSTMMFFIHVSELEGRFNPSLFIGLSPYFDQLTGEQLSPICEHLAKNSFDAQHVQTLVEILKLNTDEQMGSLINGGLDQEILQRRPDVLLNILKRVQAFIQTEGRLNMNNWNLSNNLFSYLLFSFHPAEIEEQTAKTLLVLQRFGFDDWQGLKQFIHYCPILEFEEDDLAAYGALEQYQKRVFSFLDSSISLADARRLLELAKTIVNEHEVEYLLYFTPRNRADVAGFLGGQVDTAQMAAKQGSVDAFCALSERTKQAYPTLFARMHEVSGGDTRHYSEASYRVLYALEYSRALSFVTGLQEAEIAQLAEALTVFRLPLAEEIFFELYNLINGVELIQFLYEKQGVLDRFSDDGPDTDKSLLRTFVRFTPTIQQMRDFFTSFEDYHPDFDIPDLKGVLMKESNCEDMLAALADYSSKAFEDELYEALSAFKKKHDENQGPYWSKQSVRRDRFIDTYFQELVYPEDLDDMDTLMKGLGDFLGRLEEAGYDPAIDPDRSRMLTFVNPERVLNSANNRFTHVAFILNFLRDSSPDTSSEKLMEWAKEHLDAEDEKIASKAAMLMVGMGTFVQDLDKDTLHKLCRVGVDEHLTQEVISGDITQAQSDYLAREESPRIPLNLYFSFLLILKKDGRSGDQTAFEALVEGYKAIENEPVFVGKVLVLAHDKFDSTHSFANGDDAFNPEALRILAEDVGGLECDILRHREDGESLESMLSTLQTTPGDLTACVGGHGNHDIISFGEEWFDMRQLFEVLAGRLEMQEEGEEPWVTQVLFTSCHSDYNSVLLNAMWERDQRTQGHPITFLSSSSEDSPSFKMAEDSWFVKAQQAAQEEGRGHLTWGEFFRDIESRTFIMSLIGEGYFGNKYRVNSNNNLYIDGKWRG